MTDHEIFKKLAELQDIGIPACLATIVGTESSTPRDIGAKMIVCVDGTMYGSVGGGCGESKVRRAALHIIVNNGKPRLLEIDLAEDLGISGGDVCGGKMFVFVERL